ncbi:TVP38/TMEM64 family protein [Rhodovastum atsumiense]|uniref:TVP38/TMEM64 family membrane protein n=1 Tax=Rhodovastum atsumiense TaxID=504468 RepID=A0A5M6IKZ6_9PROT|nr:TVP38/TMEM64 family protein [Rhodovastum atsumiense]
MGVLWRPALLVVVLLGGQLVLKAVLGGDAAALLESVVARHQTLAELLFVPATAALCFLGVPRQVPAYAAGLAFGLWGGTVVSLLGVVLGCIASFYWARLVAQDWAQRRLGTRMARLDRFLAANPFSATLMLRLLPVGNNLLLNLLAGVSAVAAGPFLLASLLGYLPQTLVFALIGAGTRVDQQVMLGLGAALFAISGAIGFVLLRRLRAGRYGAAL